MGGRPKTDPQKIKQAVKLYQTGQYSVKEIETLTGVKIATLCWNIERNVHRSNSVDETL